MGTTPGYQVVSWRRLKDAVDLETVRADLAGVVSQALEPAHVSVWINERG